MIGVRLAMAALALMGMAYAAEDEAGAGTGKPPCENFPWAMDREKAAFAANPTAATSGASLDTMPIGAVKLELKPLAEAGLPVQPSRAPKDPATANAGYVTLPAVKAGSYQITTGRGVWIDPVQANTAVKSSAHGADKTCSLFRKSIRFDLKDGPVTLDFIGPEKSIVFTILPAQ